jgi:hypothetical protein
MRPITTVKIKHHKCFLILDGGNRRLYRRFFRRRGTGFTHRPVNPNRLAV